MNHLDAINDPVIKLFRKHELQPIMTESAYHSPELSETDQENPTDKRRIIVKDLKWRSATVSLLNMIILLKFQIYLSLFICSYDDFCVIT